MNKKLLFSVGFVFLAITLLIASGLLRDNPPSSLTNGERQQLPNDQSIEEGFMEAEKLINSRAPIKIDDKTRLDRAIAGPGDLMTYFYSLTTIAVTDVEPATVLADIKPNVLKSLCSNPDMQPVLQAGARLVYVYSDMAGKEIGRINVVAADC